MVKAIVGANWGDEGKGKITDMDAVILGLYLMVVFLRKHWSMNCMV